MSVLIDTLNLGASQTNNGDYSAAIETYLGAIEIDDRSATAWFCLGVLHKTGSKIDAVEAFERSDAICPDHPLDSSQSSISSR